MIKLNFDFVSSAVYKAKNGKDYHSIKAVVDGVLVAFELDNSALAVDFARLPVGQSCVGEFRVKTAFQTGRLELVLCSVQKVGK